MHTYRTLAQIITMLCLSMILLASCTPGATTAPTATPVPTAATAPDLKQAIVGTWTSTVTKEDLLRVVPDFKQEHLCDNAGTFIWEFKADGTFAIDQTPLTDCPTPDTTHIEDKWSVDGTLVTFGKDTPDQEVYEGILEGDSLVFKRKSGECVPCLATNTAHPWKRTK